MLQPSSSRLSGPFPTRVCYVVNEMPPEVGHLRRLAEHVELIVIVTRPWRGLPPQHDGLTVRYVRALGPAHAPVRQVHPGLLRLLHELQPDLIHVVLEPWGLAAAQCALHVRRHPDVGLLLHGCDRIWWHGSPIEVRLKRRLARFVLQRATAFAAETAAVFEVATASGLSDRAPTAQVHTQPRDPSVFRPVGLVGQRDARSRLGLPADGPGIVLLGRLVPEKGPLLLLAAWRALPEAARERSWLAIAGDGPLADEMERAAADTRGVFWLGSLRFPDQVLDLLHSADVVAVPSFRIPDWDDQSPRTVIEGLLTGAVVIGARSGGIPVMLGDVGVIVEEGSVPSLTEGLAHALAVVADDDLRSRARQSSVARGSALYATDRVAEQTLALWARSGIRVAPVSRA